MTRLVFYLEIYIQVAEAFLPLDVADGGTYMTYKILVGYMTFWLSYFEWWPSFICSLLVLVPFALARIEFYHESVALLSVQLVVYMIWHAMNLLFIHIIITKVGMLYADTEVLRSGNNQLLDDLDEGIVLFDEKEKGIIYHNLSKGLNEKVTSFT